MLIHTPDSSGLPKPMRAFIPLAGLNDHEFTVLVQAVKSGLTPVQGRPWSLPFPTRVLLVAVALRTNITTRAVAVLFTTTQSTADRVIRHLTPIIGKQLRAAPESRDEGTWLIDGTLIPVHDQTRTALSKNYRRSINTQIMTRYANRRVIAVGKTWPGNRNDIVVAKATMADIVAQAPSAVLGDGAYQSMPGVTTPKRDSTGRIIRDKAWELHRKVRASVEHVIARLKDWQILRQCRRKDKGIDEALEAVAGIYNLRIDLRVNS
jgi:hypothetical protein